LSFNTASLLKLFHPAIFSTCILYFGCQSKFFSGRPSKVHHNEVNILMISLIRRNSFRFFIYKISSLTLKACRLAGRTLQTTSRWRGSKIATNSYRYCTFQNQNQSPMSTLHSVCLSLANAALLTRAE
jgi:hypothetical protein